MNLRCWLRALLPRLELLRRLLGLAHSPLILEFLAHLPFVCRLLTVASPYTTCG